MALNEFARIAKYLRPLATDPAALELRDDAAVLTSPGPDRSIVITNDMLVSGVHYLPEDPPDLVARKALRTNLSDLAAMGARPIGYTLALALPRDWTPEACEQRLNGLTSGLAVDQETFDISLLGGDSVATPDVESLSITAFGSVEVGKALRRSTGKLGHSVFVSGTIGDAGLGLKLLRLGREGDADWADYLIDRYRLPAPRLTLGQALAGLASSAMDISDGLLQDAGHIARESELGIEIELSEVPISQAGEKALSKGVLDKLDLLACGDDYELLFSIPAELEPKLIEKSRILDVPVKRIGKMAKEPGVRVHDRDGNIVKIEKRGYTHFSDTAQQAGR